MQIARLGPAGSEIPVVVVDGEKYDLRPLTSDIDAAFLASEFPSHIEQALRDGTLPALPDAGEWRIGAPIARPGKIVCIGLNYRDHAEETHADIPAEPIVFMKDPSTVVGPNDDVLIPRRSVKTDYEVELAVVIGHTARYLKDDSAAQAVIAGYAISNDVSEREFQIERGGQWDKGKSCETFNPLGPYLVPAAEIDPTALGLRLTVNGEERQNGTTANMIFPVLQVIRYLSDFMVLHPGDIVNTGTPAGVALGRPDKPYLRRGDMIELSIDGLGVQRQRMANA